MRFSGQLSIADRWRLGALRIVGLDSEILTQMPTNTASIGVNPASAPRGFQRLCDIEQIHIPGSIQPHGLLLLFDAVSGQLMHWAGDFVRLLGMEPVPSQSSYDLLEVQFNELIKSMGDCGEEAVHAGCIQPRDRAPLAMIVHRTDSFAAVELQLFGTESGAAPALELVRSISLRTATMPTLSRACEEAATQVRSITGFDRVMVYRFLEDESGLVVAEARDANVVTYLNHRFPASDIPRQARELYTRSLTRVIPDVDYMPMALQPAVDCGTVDMAQSILRSVSPVHIQYLKNMGVSASMSISLLVDGKLWGLIVCHHTAPRAVSVESMLLCRHVGTSLSAYVLSFAQAEKARAADLQASILETNLRRLRLSKDPERTLRTSIRQLQRMIDCNGAVLLEDGELVAAAGQVPNPDELRALAPLVEAQLLTRDGFWTDCIGTALAGAPPIARIASGVVAVQIEAENPLLALWFRPEQVEEISWAGDPRDKRASRLRLDPLTPRRSFATWRETVCGRSRRWLPHEVNAIELFKVRAGFTMQRHRLKQLNAELINANALLNTLATTDSLTGLANRRLFDGRLQAEWQRALRQGGSLAVIAIDVDHFKKYNDRFGHPAGDECLKRVAGAIDVACRPIDVAARIGGEEFALLLPDTDKVGAASAAERIRNAVESLGLKHPLNANGLVTISLGCAVGSTSEIEEPAQLMSAADSALYEAKASGRNRVVTSS